MSENRDEKLRRRVHAAAEDCFADARLLPKAQIMDYIDRKEESVVKKKISTFAVAFATVLLVGSVALAAGLGIFGRFTQREMNEMSAVRLNKLDAVSVPLGVAQTVTTPGTHTDDPALTDAEKALGRMAGREIELTVDQSYCDGKKLYFSYTLKTAPVDCVLGEGVPTGIDAWELEFPGVRVADCWDWQEDETLASVIEWFDAHEPAFAALDHIGVGDGAWMDGKVLNVYDSDMQWIDETTLQGYQEVHMPEGYTASDSVTIELSVLCGTTFYYQDAEGWREAYVSNPESRSIRIPVTIPVNGKLRPISGEIKKEAYAAKADLTVSDVDISGTVTFTGVEKWLKDEATGCVDKATFDALCDAAGEGDKDAFEKNNMLLPGLSLSLPEAEETQKLLAKLGLYKGEITGVMDEATVAAVKAFQQEKGIGGDPFNTTEDFIVSYQLVAGGETLRDLDGGHTGIVDGSYTLWVRFDLPQDMSSLALRPSGAQDASDDIPLS